MNFNGEKWFELTNDTKLAGEPDEYVIVKNPKMAGGVIPYARYGENWTANPVPNRPLIRLLCEALEQRTGMIFNSQLNNKEKPTHEN